MPSRRTIVIFFIKLLIIDALLMMPWPGWRDTYAAGFRAAGNVLFGSIGRDGAVQFEPADEAETDMDSTIVLRNRNTGAQAHVELNCRYAGWLPTAMTAALVLASPMCWKRKLVALAASQLFIAGRMWVYLAWLFSGGDTLAVYSPGPIGRGLLGALSDGLFASLIGSFLGPILIWLAVAVRGVDWPRVGDDSPHRG